MPSQSFSLEGKIALVTGGASGIGVGIVWALATAGAHVVIADINADGARAVAAELAQHAHKASAIALDLVDEASVIGARAKMLAEIGTPWVLVNNAGLQDRDYIADETVAGWDRAQAVNARGPFLMTREFGGAMIAAGQGGRIVNIASNAVRGMMVKGSAAYTASKGALASLTAVTALEFAEHRITVNTVLPGAVATPGAIAAKGPPTDGPGHRRAPFGLCAPEDIGHAVLFFASPGAHMVTNQMLAVDGGWSIS